MKKKTKAKPRQQNLGRRGSGFLVSLGALERRKENRMKTLYDTVIEEKKPVEII